MTRWDCQALASCCAASLEARHACRSYLYPHPPMMSMCSSPMTPSDQ